MVYCLVSNIPSPIISISMFFTGVINLYSWCDLISSETDVRIAGVASIYKLSFSEDVYHNIIVHILVVYNTFIGEWYTVFHWVSKHMHVM